MNKREKQKKPQQSLLLHDQTFLNQGYLSLTGIDEAGRGPWAGPVVASAVTVRDFSFECNLNDSKKMSAKARDIAYEEIIQKCEVGIGIVDSDEIDSINILQATFLAMKQACERLGSKPECVLVDGPLLPPIQGRVFPIVDGDAKSLAIACASVIAKVTRDRMMENYDRLYPMYGFAKHKGYGTAAHQLALKQHGPCAIHRKSFAPIKNLT